MPYFKTLLVNLIKRAYISRSLPDDIDTNVDQVSYMDKTGTCEMIVPYGLYSKAPEEHPVIVFAVQSQEDNRAGIAYSQHTRFKNLSPGESILGNEVTGSFIKLDKDGNINIESKSKIVINSASEIEINTQGNVNITVNGSVNLTSTGNVDINAPQVNLGSGGNPIARVGDTVDLMTGLITSGGNNTSI